MNKRRDDQGDLRVRRFVAQTMIIRTIVEAALTEHKDALQMDNLLGLLNEIEPLTKFNTAARE